MYQDHPSFARVLCFLLLVAMLPQGLCGGDSGESERFRISGFVMGHSWFVWDDPFRILFMRDPLFTYSLYPLPPTLGDSEKRRLDRVYYPRTGGMLIENYDLIVFHDARIEHFTPRQLHDLDYAFREAGMTSVMDFLGSFMWDWIWSITILGDVAPISGHRNAGIDSYTITFRRERDPVFTPFIEFGIEKVVGTAVAEMDVKQGATIWGEMKALSGGRLRGWIYGDIRENQPWLVSWKPGGGKPGVQWALVQLNHWPGTGGDWWSEENNPYALDIATNMVLYSLDRPLISDILARREARRLFTSLQSQKSLILSMMDWAETFGANIVPLSKRLMDLERGMEGAIGDYIEQDYLATVSFLQSMSPTASEIAKDAVRLKDTALFWIYVIEWSVALATTVTAGLVIWTLMVRRRLYKEVPGTRLTRLV